MSWSPKKTVPPSGTAAPPALAFVTDRLLEAGAFTGWHVRGTANARAPVGRYW